LLAVGSVAIFFAIVELALMALGYSETDAQSDPYVGFAGEPLFVVEPRPEGSPLLVTSPDKERFFNEQVFPLAKAPETRRVFCLGGSTTYGRPYDDEVSFCGWLRVFLPLAVPRYAWEVVNAGGISYASYRVAGVMEELSGYSPDLFIVYSGHNEFLEERTYRDVRSIPAPLRALDQVLRQTRSYTALSELVEPLRASSEHDTGRYELSGEVDALLDRSIGPRDYHRDDVLREQVTAHYALNLERMVAMGREAGAEVLLVTPASDLAGSSPFKSELAAALSEADAERFALLLERGRELLEGGEFERAQRALSQAVEIDPRHAHGWFFLGQAESALGRHAEARTAFLHARDEDVCPLRALSAFAPIVREVAARRGAPLVDFEAAVGLAAREVFGQAAPGPEQFLDHVHPTIEGHRALALQIIEVLSGIGWVQPGDAWNEESISEASEAVMADLDQGRHAMAFRNLAKVLSWAGKDPEAERSARRAVELDPSDSESHFIIGLLASAAGRDEQAIGAYREAVRSAPDYMKARHNLAIALARSGRHEAAIDHYERVLEHNADHPNVRFNLANALTRAGRTEAALRRYLEVIQRDPADLDAHFNLAVVYERIGELVAALRHYEEAGRLDPEDVEAAARVASLREEIGVDSGSSEPGTERQRLASGGGSEVEANAGRRSAAFPAR